MAIPGSDAAARALDGTDGRGSTNNETEILHILALAMMAYAAVLVAFGVYHVVLAVLGFRRNPSHAAADPPLDDDAPPVTFLVSAYKEGDHVVSCIDSTLEVAYPADRLKTFVILDEGDAETLDAVRRRLEPDGLREEAALDWDRLWITPRIRVLVQSSARGGGRGKPRALQNALRYLPPEGYVAFLDADHEVASDFLTRTLPHFRDSRVGIVQGRRGPREMPRSLIGTWDLLEQHVGMVHSLLARDRFGAASFYGSTAIMPVALLHDVGWENCLAEDTRLSYEVRRRGLRIAYEPRTGSVEEVVPSVRAYVRQRQRWASGHMQVLHSAFPGILRAPLLKGGRLDAIFHLNYYNVALALLTYWLLRAAHHWIQGTSGLILYALSALVLGAIAGYAYERRGARSVRTSIPGALVGGILAFATFTLLASYLEPAASPPPVPPGVEIALFAAPLAQILLGHVNKAARPANVGVLRSVWHILVFVLLALPMLLVNLYAILTGVLLSVVQVQPEWLKTPRLARRKKPWSKPN